MGRRGCNSQVKNPLFSKLCVRAMHLNVEEKGFCLPYNSTSTSFEAAVLFLLPPLPPHLQVSPVWRPGCRFPGLARWQLVSGPLSTVPLIVSQTAPTPGSFWAALSRGTHWAGRQMDWTVQLSYSAACSTPRQASPTVWPPLLKLRVSEVKCTILRSSLFISILYNFVSALHLFIRNSYMILFRF